MTIFSSKETPPLEPNSPDGKSCQDPSSCVLDNEIAGALPSAADNKRIVPLACLEFYDSDSAMEEMRRVLDICNSCRRCFNLCAFFPALFQRMDSEEIDGDSMRLSSEDIDALVPLCTLCDMCFIAKCPYVPPHPWALDFPRLMLRWRAIQNKRTGVSFTKCVSCPKAGKCAESQSMQGRGFLQFQRFLAIFYFCKKIYMRWVYKGIASIDMYGPLACFFSPIINIGLKSPWIRNILAKFAFISAKADMPSFRSTPLAKRTIAGKGPGENTVALYVTCLNNYYTSVLVNSAIDVLQYFGVSVVPIYPGCCAMPLWEQGHIEAVKIQAEKISPMLAQYETIISLGPSCTLMLKSEWPSVCPENMHVAKVSSITIDLSLYLLRLVKKLSWPKIALPPHVSAHMACHSRAQNLGNSSFQLLQQLSPHKVHLIERCSGHGGFWGYEEAHFQEALEFAQITLSQAGILEKPAVSLGGEEVRAVRFVTSDCPLAIRHFSQALREKNPREKDSVFLWGFEEEKEKGKNSRCQGCPSHCSGSGNLQEVKADSQPSTPRYSTSFVMTHPVILIAHSLGLCQLPINITLQK